MLAGRGSGMTNMRRVLRIWNGYYERVVSVETVMWAWIFDYRPILATHPLR